MSMAASQRAVRPESEGYGAPRDPAESAPAQCVSALIAAGWGSDHGAVDALGFAA